MRMRQTLGPFFFWQYLAFIVAIGSVYFVTVNLNNLNGISWGWDFAILYGAIGSFCNQGTLYEHPLNFNFPFASLFIFPYYLIPLAQAAKIKLAVTILMSGFCILLVIKIDKRIMSSNLNRFLFGLLAIEFFSIQFYTLNIYVEILCLLLLSLLMYQKNRHNACAFLLALVIVTKIFLLPLLLFPLLVRRYRLLIVTLMFMMALLVVSVLVFGIQNNLEALDVIFNRYPRIFFGCCKNPDFTPISAGYVDFFNRLHFVGLYSGSGAGVLTGVYTVVYAMVVLFVAARMWQCVTMPKARKMADRISYGIFATLLVFSILYKFRMDISLLLMGILPWFANMEQSRLKKSIVAAVFLICINHHFVIRLFEIIQLDMAASMFSEIFYVFPPQLFGISIMLVSIVSYWAVLRNELQGESAAFTDV